MNIKFEEHIKNISHQDENGLDIISVNKVIGAWQEYMRELREIYSYAHGDMEQAGSMIKIKLKEWNVL